MTPEIDSHLTANAKMSKRQIMMVNFLGGLSWGLGSVVGATVIVAVLVYLLKILGLFSTLSSFFNQSQTLP